MVIGLSSLVRGGSIPLFGLKHALVKSWNGLNGCESDAGLNDEVSG